MPETIEAEVLEIDGSPPPPVARDQESEPAWKSMRGKVLRLDRRWWPLWLLLGGVVFVLVAAIGLVVTALLVVIKGLGFILHFLSGGGTSRGKSELSRPSR